MLFTLSGCSMLLCIQHDHSSGTKRDIFTMLFQPHGKNVEKVSAKVFVGNVLLAVMEDATQWVTQQSSEVIQLWT